MLKQSKRSSKNVGDSEESFLSSIKNLLRVGGFLLLFLVATIFIWGGFAPLRSAAIATGKIVISDSNKLIQHLEGGIISEIIVKEGDLVEKDQPLLVLSDAESNAQLQILRLKLNELLATQIRLKAERANEDEVSFEDVEDVPLDEETKQKNIENQLEIFNIRNKSHREQMEIMATKIKQMQNQINGMRAQKKSMHKSLDISKEQSEIYGKLYDQHNISQVKVMELDRQISNTEGSAAEIAAEIAKVQQAIAESKISGLNIETQRHDKIINEMKENQEQIDDIRERLRVAEDVSKRNVIKAPVSGIITGLKHHTIGGVIAPGGEILNIVPDANNLVVEAALAPNDIDLVSKGSDAKVRITAYKAREFPMITGVVSHVSADSFVDEVTGADYYKVHIDLNEDAKLQGVDLQTGMPAEVYITTGEKTLLSYLLDPINSTIRKSFRED